MSEKDKRVSEILTKISLIDSSSDSAYKEYVELFKTLNGYPVFSLPLKLNSILYRSRLNDSGKNFTKLQDISYPQKNLVNDYSRANYPGQNVFYSSSGWQTSLTEILPQIYSKKLKVGQVFTVTMGEFKVKEDLIVTIIPDFKNNEMKATTNIISLRLSKFQKDFLEKINYYLVQDVFKNSNVYKLTSAFFNTIDFFLDKVGDRNDGFIYTSVQNVIKKDRGLNIVLKPKVVDQYLELVRVSNHFLTIRDFKNGKPLVDNFKTPRLATKIENAERIFW